MAAKKLRLGTRRSPLARQQAESARQALLAHHPELTPEQVALVEITTTGDKRRDRPLHELGGKALFTKELEEALYDGRVDMAVHSAKDVPTETPGDLRLAGYLPRASAFDAFICPSAAHPRDLPRGAMVGTSSVRRRAQLLYQRPDLIIAPIRGNVGTRLRKLADGEMAATILAQAGLARTGQGDKASAVLDTATLVPACGQGAVVLQVRAEDDEATGLAQTIDHQPTSTCVETERAMLAALGGTCQTPIGALAQMDAAGQVTLDGLVVRPDGTECHQDRVTAPTPAARAAGYRLGQALRARCAPDFFDDPMASDAADG